MINSLVYFYVSGRDVGAIIGDDFNGAGHYAITPRYITAFI